MIKKLFNNKYFVILLIITVILIICMLFSINKSYETKANDNFIMKITMPVQKVVYNITSGIRGFFSHFGDIAQLREENEKLEDKITDLEEKLEKNNIYKTENERLREMLNIKDTYKEFELVAANVTGKDSSTWFLSLTIDKGTDDGLQMTDTVITTDGLVGHITDIGSDWARITTILDSQSTVAVVVERTEDLATIDGDVDLAANGLCKMTYISKDSSITVGDVAKTSGLGGVYPKGIAVGKILKIHPENKGVSQYAEIEPYVNFNRIYEVFVITN